MGEVNPESVRILQEADDIFIRGLRDYKTRMKVEDARRLLAAGVPQSMVEDGEIEVSLYDRVWQAGAVLLSTVRSVGVMGDERTYDYAVAVRAVKTIDFMTAEAAEIPFEVLQTVMSRIINEVKGVNRVFYDLTSKPPGTIEFE